MDLQLDNKMTAKDIIANPRGAMGWAFLWLIGIPVPILVVLFFLRGCT